MTPLDLFAALTRDFCSVLMQGHALSLEDRVLSVQASLSAVVAAAGSLPVVPGKVVDVSSSVLDEAGWPGLASFEAYWSVGPLSAPGEPAPRTMTGTLGFLFANLFSGLELFDAGEAEAAAGRWGLGFEAVWGAEAIELLCALQPAVAGYRSDLRRAAGRSSKKQAAGLVNLAVPVAPSDQAPGRAMLGVRFDISPYGAEVLDIHPASPAAGVLGVGDVVLAVEGQILAELEADAARAMLVGEIGEICRYEVFRKSGETESVSIAAIDGREFP